MATFDPVLALTCPLDGLTFPSKTAMAKGGDVVKDSEVGSHLHLGTVSITCLNGHEWQIEELILERVS